MSFLKTFLCCCFLIVGGIRSSIAQSSNHSQEAVKNLLSASADLKHNNIDSAYVMADSALHIAKRNNYKTEIAYAYYLLASLHGLQSEYPISDSLLQLSLSYYEQLKDKHGVSQVYIEMGNNLQKIPNLDSAEYWYKQALPIKIAIEDKDGEGIIYNNLGIVEDYRGNYPEAITYYNKAIPLYKQVGNKYMESTAYHNLAVIYYNIEKYRDAVEAQKQALRINEEINNLNYASMNHIVLAESYLKLDSFKKAEDHSRQALQICEQIDYPRGKLYVLATLINIHFEAKEYDKSLEYYDSILDAMSVEKDSFILANVQLKAGQIFAAKGMPNKAIDVLSSALATFKNIGSNLEIMTAHEVLSFIYSLQNQHDQAYFHLSQSVKYKDLLDEKSRETLELKAGFEIEEIKKEIALKNVEIERSKKTRAYLTLVIVVTVLLAAAFFLVSEKQKTEKLLALEENEKLRIINGELVEENESIRSGNKTEKSHEDIENIMVTFQLTDRSKRPIRLKEIEYIEWQRNHAIVYTSDKDKFTVRGTIKEFLTHYLHTDLFVQIHKSFLVNISNIKEYKWNYVTMKNLDKELTYGLKFQQKAIKKIEGWLQNS